MADECVWLCLSRKLQHTVWSDLHYLLNSLGCVSRSIFALFLESSRCAERALDRAEEGLHEIVKFGQGVGECILTTNPN